MQNPTSKKQDILALAKLTIYSQSMYQSMY